MSALVHVTDPALGDALATASERPSAIGAGVDVPVRADTCAQRRVVGGWGSTNTR